MIEPQVRFRQIDSCETGIFENDLLVMNTETLDTIVLNPTAAVLWEALNWPQSLEDLAGLLSEVFTEEEKENLKTRVAEVLQALIIRKLLIKA
jgi:hypothetical protein